MELIYMKMINGEDILGYCVAKTESYVELLAPITIEINMEVGLCAQSWLMFSDSDSIRIDNNKFIFISKASKKSIEYYNEFMAALHKQRSKPVEFDVQLSDVYAAIMEARGATKH